MRSLVCGLACGLLWVSACGGDTTSEVRIGDVGAKLAIVTSRDSMNMSGAINTVAIPSLKVNAGIDATVDPDTVLHVIGGKLYLLNRFTNTLRIYDPTSFAAPTEIKVTSDSGKMTMYPQDFVIAKDKIFISFNGNTADTAVGIIDVAQPSAHVTRYVNVANAAADKDGGPDPAALYVCNDKVYVALSDLDMNYQPTGAGRVAVIDATTETSTGVIQLTKENPGHIVQAADDCTQALVGSGPLGAAPTDTNAGIDAVDLTAKTATSMFTSTQIGGSVASIEVALPTLAYAVVLFNPVTTSGGYINLASSKVVAFNPSKKTVIGDASGVAGYIPFARVSGSGQLFIGVDVYATLPDKGTLTGGLYVGKADGTNITDGATGISLGQSPVAIDFN